MLKEETVKELKKILKEEYGHDLSIQEVTEMADVLVNCFDLLAKIYHRTNIKEECKTKKSSNNIMHFLSFEKMLY